MIIVLTCLLVANGPSTAKPPPVSADTALSYVENLADPWRYNGRKSGALGGDWSMTIIAERFAAWGLQPLINRDFLVPFEMLATEEKKAHLELTYSPWGKIEYLLGDDYVLCTNSGSGKVHSNVTFVGHGISEPMKGWDDYQGTDVTGRIVVVLRGEPETGEDFREENSRTYTLTEAVARGAKAVLYYDKAFPSGGPAIFQEAYNPDIPVGYIGDRVMRHLLAGSGYSLKNYREKLKEGPFPLHLNAILKFKAKVKLIEEGKGWNVAGKVPGTDPQLSGEAVIFGAHGDHVGMNAEGLIYPGADDNASGAGIVMELARAFARYPQPRTMIFCIFGGEEQGLLGSKDLVTKLPEEYQYVNMVNLDMAGRGDGTLGLGGGDMLPEVWSSWWKGLGEDRKEKIKALRAWGGESSDFAPFRDIGIPAFTAYSAGSHDFYHTPMDEFHTIHREAISGVLSGLASWGEAVGSYPSQLKKARLKERTFWHQGLAFSWHNGTGEPTLDLDLAKRRLEQGYMGIVLSLPPLPDSGRIETMFRVLDRWHDAVDVVPEIVIAPKLNEMPGNAHRRKGSLFLALEADSLVPADTVIIQAAHLLGIGWSILRDHSLWTFEGAVRADRAVLLRELAKEDAVIQVPLRDAQEWVPVAQKQPGSVVAVGDWSEFAAASDKVLGELREAKAGLVVITGPRDIRPSIGESRRIEKFRAQVQPMEQEYDRTLAWNGAYLAAGLKEEILLQWIRDNQKLWIYGDARK